MFGRQPTLLEPMVRIELTLFPAYETGAIPLCDIGV
jgi:hypothetical protein